MERVGRVSKNAAALVGARIVTSSLTFLLAIIINRNLGPEKAGIYNYAFALYTIFQVLPDFGIGNISIRDVSQENSRLRRYLRNIVTLRLLLGLISFVLLMLVNFISLALQGPGALGAEKFWVVFSLAFCLLVEQPFSNSLAEGFIALEKLTVVALVYLIMGVMKVALSIYVIMAEMRGVLVLLVLVYLITYLYSILHFYLLYRRLLRSREFQAVPPEEAAVAEAMAHRSEFAGETLLKALLADYSFEDLEKSPGERIGPERPAGAPGEGGTEAAPGGERGPFDTPPVPPQLEENVKRLGPLFYDRRFWRYILVSAWPLAVVAAGVTVYAGMDIPILSWIRGDVEVGLYGAAGMFAKASVFLTLALNMAVLPAVSKVGGKHPQRLGTLWERLIRYTWILVIPLAVIIPVLARPVLLLQKHQYIEAWPATWLTMAAMNFTFMTAVTFPFFIVINRQKIITRVVIIGLVFKGILDLATVFLWGYMGAAATAAVSELIIFLLLARSFSREVDHRLRFLRFAGAPLLSLGVLYGAAFVLHRLLAAGKDTFLSSLPSAAIASAILAALFIALALLTRMLDRKGLRELNELLTV
jgi:O-antigen/teichoic acid export membrane protein